MNNTVVDPATILSIKILVSFSNETLLNVLPQPVLFALDYSFTVRVQGEQP